MPELCDGCLPGGAPQTHAWLVRAFLGLKRLLSTCLRLTLRIVIQPRTKQTKAPTSRGLHRNRRDREQMAKYILHSLVALVLRKKTRPLRRQRREVSDEEKTEQKPEWRQGASPEGVWEKSIFRSRGQQVQRSLAGPCLAWPKDGREGLGLELCGQGRGSVATARGVARSRAIRAFPPSKNWGFILSKTSASDNALTWSHVWYGYVERGVWRQTQSASPCLFL